MRSVVMAGKKNMGRQYSPYVVLETKNNIFTISPEIPICPPTPPITVGSFTVGERKCILKSRRLASTAEIGPALLAQPVSF